MVKKRYFLSILAAVLGVMMLLNVSCAKKEEAEKQGKKATPEKVPVKVVQKAGELVYIPVVNAEVSSFDTTPDWAPEPNAMAATDSSVTTRWSSDYSPGEQWIYFDLGRESIINNIVIKWERAYATAYDILASMDAENWVEIHQERNANGGVIEAYVSPIKCRYIKILAKERINKAWGVSIWEVEIYGPKSANPHGVVMKEDYIRKGEDEAQLREAENLIEQYAGPLVSVAEKSFQKGIVYTSWMANELSLPVSDLTLAEVKAAGFDTVAIMVPAYQETLDSAHIFTNDVPGGDTPTIEALAHAVQTCHRLGLRVMLKPHVDPRTDEARINIRPSEAWFDSYEDFIVRYARFSEENKIELFSIGTELEATTFDAWAERWNNIIDKVRENYKGVLTYSANWTEYKEVPFWDRMDFIGIDAYFPLTDQNNPSLEELREAWLSKTEEIEAWLNDKGLLEKGVLFTEVGYPSADGANRQPWVAITEVEDEQEQADCLQAMFEATEGCSWFKGYYIWQYFPQERWSPLGFTVKGKKAEQIINAWLSRK